MNWGILTSVLLYEIIVIVGIGMYLSAKAAKAEQAGESFMLSGRDLPLPVVAVTLALTVLGTAHILGIFEMTWFLGAVSFWFSLAHVILLVVACLATGRWVRRTNITTVPELTQILYDRKVRILIGCVMAPTIFGILTLETQGVGIVMSAMTGWSIREGAIVGGILGLLYVLLAGMKEIGWVNLVNTIIMYVGIVIATVYLTINLPGSGWDTVADYYVSQNQPHMLSIWGTPELLMTFALGITLSVTFCQGISQMLMQTAMSAKDEETVKKALWIAAPVNGIFGIFTVCMGLAAKSIPAYNALGPKMAATTMLVELLPGWLVAWLLATFLGAILSTFAMTVLTPATIFVKDIWVELYNPKATEAEQTKLVRIVIVVLGIIAMGIASFLPPILAAIGWLFAWMVPVFWLVVGGLFWKRNANAALTTLIITWALNCLWSFTELPKAVNLPWLDNTYITLISTFVVGGILTALMDGKPGYFRSAEYRQAKKMAQTA